MREHELASAKPEIRVGKQVKITCASHKNQIGTVANIDDSHLPFYVEFADGRSEWFFVDEVELHEPVQPSPEDEKKVAIAKLADMEVDRESELEAADLRMITAGGLPGEDVEPTGFMRPCESCNGKGTGVNAAGYTVPCVDCEGTGIQADAFEVAIRRNEAFNPTTPKIPLYTLGKLIPDTAPRLEHIIVTPENKAEIDALHEQHLLAYEAMFDLKAKNVALQAELTTARQQRIQVESSAAAVVVAFKRVSEIVSFRYGEDENEDSDELNNCFEVLQNADAGSALLDVLRPFAQVAKEVREDRDSVFDTLSVSVLYKWLADAEKVLNGK
jgi:hypothetical protein